MSEVDITPDQLQELKDRLTSERQELSNLVKSLSEVTGTKHDCEILDVGDSASLNEMRVRAARKGASTTHRATVPGSTSNQ